jgi:hypothetical protein
MNACMHVQEMIPTAMKRLVFCEFAGELISCWDVFEFVSVISGRNHFELCTMRNRVSTTRPRGKACQKILFATDSQYYIIYPFLEQCLSR